MKKTLIILTLTVLVYVGWQIFHQSQPTPKNEISQPLAPPSTNLGATPTAPPLAISSNAFVRPDSIDEDHWNRLMLIRQLALEQNQPVEFYARIEDENGNPVEGAQLQITLSRINEKMFETTNFFSMKMGSEIVHLPIKLVSDINGWTQVTGFTGKALWVDGLIKEGYVAQNYDGGVAYEPNGVRTPISDILMTNAWNPQKGYIFHLQKIVEINAVK